MAKTIRLNIENAKSDSSIINELHISAKKYSLYENCKILYIYRGKKIDSEYKCYEVLFGEENFIHLTVFAKSKIGAKDFYRKCKEGTIKIGEVNFKENRKVTSAKLDVLPMLLDHTSVKIFQMGQKNLITESVNFEVGIGNNSGIIGFDRRFSKIAVPVTVLKRPIRDYVSNPENVVAILMKNRSDKFYHTIISTVSKGIKIDELPEFIKKKIDSSIIEQELLKRV